MSDVTTYLIIFCLLSKCTGMFLSDVENNSYWRYWKSIYKLKNLFSFLGRELVEVSESAWNLTVESNGWDIKRNILSINVAAKLTFDAQW
jgi:hypothetical protein